MKIPFTELKYQRERKVARDTKKKKKKKKKKKNKYLNKHFK